MSVLDQIGDVMNKQKINKDITNMKNSITNMKNSITNESLDNVSKSFTTLPSVDITIDMTDMSKEVSKDGILKYTENKFDDFGNITETTTFTDFINMKWQGSSSIYLPKKNFSIKMLGVLNNILQNQLLFIVCNNILKNCERLSFRA